MSRIDSDSTGFNMGRAAEITQDELKFQKYINRLHIRFSQLFMLALEKQLLLKAIITSEDWENFKNKIHFNFKKDNYHSELKDAEILRERLSTLQLLDPYVGIFYSQEWIKKNILMQSEEDISTMKKQIDSEEVFPLSALAQMQAQEDEEAQAQAEKKPPEKKEAPKKSSTKPKTSKPSLKHSVGGKATSGGDPIRTEIVNAGSGPYTRNMPEKYFGWKKPLEKAKAKNTK